MAEYRFPGVLIVVGIQFGGKVNVPAQRGKKHVDQIVENLPRIRYGRGGGGSRHVLIDRLRCVQQTIMTEDRQRF